jgi:putative alpha-1,2-mannosidase
MEWQPIETAPKKDAEFLVFLPRERSPIQAAWINQNGVFVVGNTFAFDLSCKPTHWMPLPPAPKE